jgi:MoxR-like ATPase
VLNSTLRAAHAVLDEVERAVVGKRDVLELVLMGFLADGHVPSRRPARCAKTLMARSFGGDGSFVPADPVHTRPAALDITGATLLDQRTTFSWPGPLFANLARRRNRAPATQAALLDMMAGVTGDRRLHHLSARAAVPQVVATEPDRVRGHHPLPEAH